MPFTIPDNDEATYGPQSIWMQSDIDSIERGISGGGVLARADAYGNIPHYCRVTAHSPANMSVDVAAGNVLVSCKGTHREPLPYVFAATNVSINTADATYPRIDMLAISEIDGTIDYFSGTPAAQPKASTLTTDDVLLAMVYVPAACTAITAAMIVDKRIFTLARLISQPGWLFHGEMSKAFAELTNYAFITKVHIQVVEAFNSDGTDLLTVGYASDHDALVEALDVSTTGIKTPTYGVAMGWTGTVLHPTPPPCGLQELLIYYTPGGSAPTTGEVLVIVEYVPVFVTY